MEALLEKYADATNPLEVLDVGSAVVNSKHPHGTPIAGGTYRALCPAPWHYIGLDIGPGVNVDLVASELYRWPVKADSVDVVISGQCLEHVPEPWTWMDEVFRVCKPGGLAIIIAPSGGKQHRFPVDCWRILPDGMRHTMERAGFNVLVASFDYVAPQHWNDCYGVGQKCGV